MSWKRGWSLRDLKSKKLIVHLTPAMHGAVANEATKAGISMGEYVRRAVKKSLDLERLVTTPVIPTTMGAIDEY